MNFSELTAEAIKLRIREEVPPHETGLSAEMLRMGKMRQDQIGELTARLKESEADRAARLVLINELADKLKESEADREARFRQITELAGLLKTSEADRAARFEQITELNGLLVASEADRAARMEVIRGLEEKVMQLHDLLEAEKQRAEMEKQRAKMEKQRADNCEQGWQALEETSAVRQARRIGIIRTRCYERRDQDAAEE